MQDDKLEISPRLDIASLNRSELTEAERPLEALSSDQGELFFQRYPDGVLKLYKKNTIVGDTPAGYSENDVVVRVLVKPVGQEPYVVIIPTTRIQLDAPGYEDFLGRAAWEWRR